MSMRSQSLRSTLVVSIAGILSLFAASACTRAPPSAPVHVSTRGAYSVDEVFAHATELLGQTIAVDIYGSILDAHHDSLSASGQWTVDSAGRTAFQLVGEDWDPAQPEKPAPGLPQKIDGPVRVVGELLRDTVRGARSNRDWLVLRVASIEPLTWPEPEHLSSSSELDRHPERWNGHYVECEGDLSVGFEVYRLDPDTWVRQHSSIVISGFRPSRKQHRSEATRSRVRVVGFAYTSAKGQGYGHLNMYSSMIVVTRLIYLSPPKSLYP